jgi:hypothetical protein
VTLPEALARRFPKATQRLRYYERAYSAPSPDHAGLNALLRKLEWVE